MAYVIADRVKETTTTTGTGTITLLGAVVGFRSFGSVMYDGDTCDYCIDGGAEWEIGTGTWTPGNLARTMVFSSSSTNTLVAFSAGTKDVFLTISSDHYVGGSSSMVGIVIGTGAIAGAASSIIIGDNARGGGPGVTAIGSSSTSFFPGSVALGNSTTTTDTQQIAIGPRHLELTSIATPPAPLTGKARVYTDGVASLLVRFPTGAAVVLANAATTQPLDSDLTAIAALTTTAYGRALLTFASGAALANEPALLAALNAKYGVKDGTGWTAYTPTFLGTSQNPYVGSNGSITGKYKLDPNTRTCMFWASFIFSNSAGSPTFGAGDFMFGLPVPTVAPMWTPVGSGYMTWAGVRYNCQAYIYNNSSVQLYAPLGPVGNSVPGTPTANSSVTFSGQYEY